MCPKNGTGCTARRHGTYTAYNSHGCRCPDALRAHRSYKKRRAAGLQPDALTTTAPSRRRIQALQAIGYSRKHLADHLGYACPSHQSLSPMFCRDRIHRDLADCITALYERLSMHPGPSRSARIRAANRGYLPPLAWDDIDNGTAAALPATSENGDREVDQIAVVRAVNGHPPAMLRRVDRLAAIAHLAESGMPSTDIADLLRVGVDRVRTDRNRNIPDNQRLCARREAGDAS